MHACNSDSAKGANDSICCFCVMHARLSTVRTVQNQSHRVSLLAWRLESLLPRMLGASKHAIYTSIQTEQTNRPRPAQQLHGDYHCVQTIMYLNCLASRRNEGRTQCRMWSSRTCALPRLNCAKGQMCKYVGLMETPPPIPLVIGRRYPGRPFRSFSSTTGGFELHAYQATGQGT